MFYRQILDIETDTSKAVIKKTPSTIYWEFCFFSSITHKMPAPVLIKIKSRIPTVWPKDQAHYIF